MTFRSNRSATESAPARRRILVIDDHPIVTHGITKMVNNELDLEVCGTAKDYGPALDKVDALRPDLVLLDATLKGRGGLDLLRDIRTRHASQRVLMLSTNDESIYAERSLKAGASGYIMKGEAAETLIFAIRSVLNGEVYLSRGLQRKLVKRLLSNESTPVVDPFAQLSDRELEVFSLIGQGKTTRQIAQDLYLSKKTIEAHRAHLKKKLGAKTTAELVRRAVQFNRNHT